MLASLYTSAPSRAPTACLDASTRSPALAPFAPGTVDAISTEPRLDGPGDPCLEAGLIAGLPVGPDQQPGDPCEPIEGGLLAMLPATAFETAMQGSAIAVLDGPRDAGADGPPAALSFFNHAPPPRDLSYASRLNGVSPSVEGYRGARGTTPFDGAAIDPDLVRPKSLKEQALSVPPGTPGVDGHTEVEVGPAATTRNLVDRARAAGLADPEVAKLEGILRDSPDFAADAALVDDLLNTENPARALRTFNDLDVYRRQNGDRITPDIVRTLTLGVGRARTDASQGREGILGNESAINAAEALVRMSDTDYAALRDLLDRAGPKGGPADFLAADAQTEKALLLKAAAARRDAFGDPAQPDGELSSAMARIGTFADAIRGRNPALLIERTSALDLDGDSRDEALQQKWSMSCSQATMQLAQAEADPIYAWDLHFDVLHNTATTGAIADEQKDLLEQAGGTATPRGTGGVGTSADMITAGMNGLISPATGRVYEDQEVGDDVSSRTYAADQIERLVRTGTDVPIGVKWNGGGAHALLVSDVRGTGNNREFLVTDPWTGKTDWVSRASFIAGNTNFFAGNGRIYHYWW